MPNIREIKRKARRDLHKHLSLLALYLVPSATPNEYETPIPVTVRVHTKFDALGDMKGTNFHYAEKQETVPKIIFMRDQILKPVRHAIVSVDLGEAYRIDNTLPPDDITIAAEVTRLSAVETLGLPIPDPDTGLPEEGIDGEYYFDDAGQYAYSPTDDLSQTMVYQGEEVPEASDEVDSAMFADDLHLYQYVFNNDMTEQYSTEDA